jgi:hypothetical protein
VKAIEGEKRREREMGGTERKQKQKQKRTVERAKALRTHARKLFSLTYPTRKTMYLRGTQLIHTQGKEYSRAHHTQKGKYIHTHTHTHTPTPTPTPTPTHLLVRAPWAVNLSSPGRLRKASLISQNLTQRSSRAIEAIIPARVGHHSIWISGLVFPVSLQIYVSQGKHSHKCNEKREREREVEDMRDRERERERERERAK